VRRWSRWRVAGGPVLAGLRSGAAREECGDREEFVISNYPPLALGLPILS
jgi:hypothetical protein